MPHLPQLFVFSCLLGICGSALQSPSLLLHEVEMFAITPNLDFQPSDLRSHELALIQLILYHSEAEFLNTIGVAINIMMHPI